MKTTLLSYFLIGCCFFSLNAQLTITELMPSNSLTTFTDGGYYDWIEIYNESNTTIDLSEYTLSDDEAELDMWTFPSVMLESNEYLVVYASKKDGESGNSEIHTNFKISASGESIYLSKNEQILQETPEFDVEKDFSIALLEGNWEVSNTPTPGKVNTDFNDCFGDSKGTATVDFCSVCSGGNSPNIPNECLGSLFINEVVSNNKEDGVLDPSGEYTDRIEIYNGGSNTIDVAGLVLRDSKDSYTIPYDVPATNLGPDEYLVIWANGGDEGDFLNTNFKLSAEGEQLDLIYNNDTLQTLIIPALDSNTSYGRINDEYKVYSTPTNGASNPNLFDCFEEWEGTAAVDSCDTCSGGNTDIEINKCGVTGLKDGYGDEVFHLFPNPVESTVHFNQIVAWTLFNSQGLEVDSGTSDQIDLESIPSSVYFLVTKQGKVKLVKI